MMIKFLFNKDRISAGKCLEIGKLLLKIDQSVEFEEIKRYDDE